MNLFGVTSWEDGVTRYMEIMTIFGVPRYELISGLFLEWWNLELS
jgi:hypothetical protein